MSDDQRAKKLEMLRNQVNFLRSSFDTVQIFATKHDEDVGETTYYTQGSGNWCARYGHVKVWILGEEHDAEEQG